VEVQATCVIYNLSHGSKLLTCSKLFALDKSTIRLVIHRVVITINIVFTNLISWPMGGNTKVVMVKFKDLVNVHHGAINGMHISISKLNIPFCSGLLLSQDKRLCNCGIGNSC
jgi:hypothetical protein